MCECTERTRERRWCECIRATGERRRCECTKEQVSGDGANVQREQVSGDGANVEREQVRANQIIARTKTWCVGWDENARRGAKTTSRGWKAVMPRSDARVLAEGRYGTASSDRAAPEAYLSIIRSGRAATAPRHGRAHLRPRDAAGETMRAFCPSARWRWIVLTQRLRDETYHFAGAPLFRHRTQAQIAA